MMTRCDFTSCWDMVYLIYVHLDRCGGKNMIKEEFDVVVVDEATQALEGLYTSIAGRVKIVYGC